MKQTFDQPHTEETLIGNREIDEAYNRACKVLSEPIDPSTFTDYKDVENDLAHVEKLEKLFAERMTQDAPEVQRTKKLAKIFEAIIFEHAEQSNWFGESATTIQTARYDDYVNKVDAIVEFKEEDSGASHIALAMDITIAERFGQKFDHIKQGIESGKLAEIKYFASEHLNIRGRKDKVPHVVIGVDRKTLFDVIKAWISRRDRRLADHPVQIKILEEIRLQLIAYREYAKSVGKEELVPIFERTENIITKIMKEKEITPDDLREIGNDEMFNAIRLNAEHIADRSPSTQLKIAN